MTPVQTPLHWTRWRGCTATSTSSTRPGNLPPDLLQCQWHPKWLTSIIIPSHWNGFRQFLGTFTTGEISYIGCRTDVDVYGHKVNRHKQYYCWVNLTMVWLTNLFTHSKQAKWLKAPSLNFANVIIYRIILSLTLFVWYIFGLYLSCLVCLSVGFLEKWDQCVINALRAEFYFSMPPIPPPHDRVTLLDTGPQERLKV